MCHAAVVFQPGMVPAGGAGRLGKDGLVASLRLIVLFGAGGELPVEDQPCSEK